MNSFFFWLNVIASIMTIATTVHQVWRRYSRKRKRSRQSFKE